MIKWSLRCRAGEGAMDRQKVGKTLFFGSLLWSLGWGIIGSIAVNPYVKNLTMEELNQTIWALEGPLHMLWGVGGVPLGIIVAAIGLLLYSGASGRTTALVGTGMVVSIIITTTFVSFGYFPVMFGVGGSSILLLFFGILWLWAKERRALTGVLATAADLRLVGYLFMLHAAWFTCAVAPVPFVKAFEGVEPVNPILIMVPLVFGWLFFFLSHLKAQSNS